MAEEKTKKKINRTFRGVVVSDKNDKTAVVRVDRVKLHLKYHKRYTASKNYKAHDEKNEYKVGDEVAIQECRPLSKDKRWRVIGKVGQKQVIEDIEDKELEELDSAEEVEKIEKKVEEAQEAGDVGGNEINKESESGEADNS